VTSLRGKQSGTAASVTAPPPAPSDYTQLARLGRTSRRAYLAGFSVILGSWLGLGLVATLLIARLSPTALDPSGTTLLSYLLVNVSLLTLLAGVVAAVRLIHRRPVRTLITPSPRVDLRRIVRSVVLVASLLAATHVVMALWRPDDYHLTLDLPRWLVLLPVILIVTSLQVVGEELFFRGYVLQALALKTRRRSLLVAVSAIEFAIPHVVNVALGGHWVSGSLYYLMMGAFFALVTLRDGRLELAIGAHAANNLFVALLVNPGHSGMPTQAVWQTSGDHSLYGLLATGVILAIFYGLLVKTPRVLVGPDRESTTRRPGDHRVPPLSRQTRSR
jgi:membrane protease YdiL (CAAX protease family)